MKLLSALMSLPFRRRHKYDVERTGQGIAAQNILFAQSRQQIRARLRAICFAELSERYNEPRPIRRSMALALARNRYRARTTGVRSAAKGAAA